MFHKVDVIQNYIESHLVPITDQELDQMAEEKIQKERSVQEPTRSRLLFHKSKKSFGSAQNNNNNNNNNNTNSMPESPHQGSLSGSVLWSSPRIQSDPKNNIQQQEQTSIRIEKNDKKTPFELNRQSVSGGDERPSTS
jgi:hypothetical protein